MASDGAGSSKPEGRGVGGAGTAVRPSGSAFRSRPSPRLYCLRPLAAYVVEDLWALDAPQGFAPTHELSARKVILVRLRADRQRFLRDDDCAALDQVLDELVAAGVLHDEAGTLRWADSSLAVSLRRPAELPAPSPDQRAVGGAEPANENEKRACRAYVQRRREKGDHRPDDTLREEHRNRYRGRGTLLGRAEADVTEHVPRSVPRNVPRAEIATITSRHLRNSSSSSPKHLEIKNKKEEEEGPCGNAAGARTGMSGPEHPERLTEHSRSTAHRPQDDLDAIVLRPRAAGIDRVADGASVDTRRGTVGGSDGDLRLGRVGFEGLRRAGERLAPNHNERELRELAAVMRRHNFSTGDMQLAGAVLGQIDVASKYHWDSETAARGAVKLSLLLGRSGAAGRDGSRIVELVEAGRRQADRAAKRSEVVAPGPVRGPTGATIGAARSPARPPTSGSLSGARASASPSAGASPPRVGELATERAREIAANSQQPKSGLAAQLKEARERMMLSARQARPAPLLTGRGARDGTADRANHIEDAPHTDGEASKVALRQRSGMHPELGEREACDGSAAVRDGCSESAASEAAATIPVSERDG